MPDNRALHFPYTTLFRSSRVALSGGAISNLGIIDIIGDSSISNDALSNTQLTVDATKTLNLSGVARKSTRLNSSHQINSNAVCSMTKNALNNTPPTEQDT